MRATHVMGLDLGPPGEPTGFVVVERPPTETPPEEPVYHLRHLERFPPGTPYPAIVEAVVRRAATPPLGRSPLVVDRTAVGRAVIDRLRRAQSAPRLVQVVIGAGHDVQPAEDGSLVVPKKELVTCLQVLLQTRRLKIAPGLPDSDVLAAELSGFRLRRVSADVSDSVEWRVGRHDDLVLAVALACWHADRYRPVRPGDIRVGGTTMVGKFFAEGGTW